MLQEIKMKIDEILSFIEKGNLEKQEVFSVKEAAAYMKISTSTLYKLTSSRKIVFYRPENKLILFKRADLEEYMFRNKQAIQKL